jgi:ABC transporter DrrB family efflux protein
MTAITASPDRPYPSRAPEVPGGAAPRVTPAVAVTDGIVVAWRNLMSMLRTPEVLVFSSIQPIIFVLMFRFVFGGAITVPGESYVNFLMPGIFIQTVAFGSVTTAIGMATDLQGGVIDRFRSLPMARSAVLAGRTIADLVRSVWVVILMAVVGTAVGFRVQTNPLAALAAAGIILLFAFALSWVFAFFGLVTANPEAAQAASFPFLAIFVFASSAFVPLDTMPGWLQAFAEHQPVTAAINAVRALVLGGPTASDVLQALAWCIGIIVVFAPLAVHRYRRSA